MPTDPQPLDSWDSERTWATFENGDAIGEYRGVELQKSVDDLERYHEIIEVSQPDVVIETGSRDGGSALWFRFMENLSVVSIDQLPRYSAPPDGDQIEWVIADSINEKMVQSVAKGLKGKRVMVSLDSDHHSPHVQAEIALYAPLVSSGCYLVIEDGCFDLWEPRRAVRGGRRIPEWGGPLDAIRKQSGWLQSQGFWRDESVEAISPISHSPVGWWRNDD